MRLLSSQVPAEAGRREMYRDLDPKARPMTTEKLHAQGPMGLALGEHGKWMTIKYDRKRPGFGLQSRIFLLPDFSP